MAEWPQTMWHDENGDPPDQLLHPREYSPTVVIPADLGRELYEALLAIAQQHLGSTHPAWDALERYEREVGDG